MKIIQSIINELVDSEISLTNPFLKTKVLATKLNNKDLLDWVNQELNGYLDKSLIPKYRIVNTSSMCSYISGNYNITNQPLPSFSFPEEVREIMTTSKLEVSLKTLESYIENGTNGILVHPYRAEIIHGFSKEISRINKRSIQIYRAWKEIPRVTIVQVLSEMRTKLLDLMLKISNEFGDLNLDELGNHKQQINTIINNMNNIINGDGNTLNTGNKNTITTNVNISKGNQEALKNELLDNGVNDEDITEIIEIVNQEEPDYENKKLGQRTNKWIQKMIGKSLDGSWEIGVGAAGELLTSALKNYFGL